MRKIFALSLFLLIQNCLIAQTLSSSNLPLIIINTNGQTIPDEPKIMADMGIIFNGEGIRNNLNDPFNHYNGKIGIEIRGQSSQMFPMKSYSLELRDASGNSLEKSLFGMPKESNWVLYAPYTDKTLMRNFLAYTISNELGRWAAHCRFVEVFINGDYKGIYVFMERIKRGSGRVNVTKMAATDITGDAVTGGYIFSLDKEPNGWFSSFVAPFSTTQNKRQFSYVYPKPENIVPAQKNYIKSYVDSFEFALASPDYQDPVVGVRKFADIPSFIDYFIVNEMSRNVDAYRLSAFFYKDRDSKNRKIFAGPVWDYDLAFRNANYCSGSDIAGWAYKFNEVCPGDGAGLVPFWWDRFMEDSAFKSMLRCRWKQVRQTSLSNQRIFFLVDSINNLVSEAQKRHFVRWPVLGQYIWPNPNPIPTSYAEEITALKTWIEYRMDWIDENIPNNGTCYDYPATERRSIIVNVFPNPLTDQCKIRVQSKYNQALQVNIYDAMGRQISRRSFALMPGENLLSLSTSSWSSGIYFVNWRSGRGEIETKAIFKK